MRELVILLAALAAFTSQVHAKQLMPFYSGPWSGGAYGNEHTGQLTSCIASANYNSGITMVVMVTRDWRWELGFASDQWRLRQGSTIPLQYRFDNGPWHRASADIIAENHMRLPMPVDGDVVENFRERLWMHIHDGRQYSSFALTGTSQLLVDLVACVATQLAVEDPVPEAEKGADDSLRLEGTRVLSNFLVSAGLRGVIIGPDTTPENLKDFHAVALAGNQLGFTMVLPEAPSGAPQELTGTVLSTVSSGCTGQFLSGSSIEIVQGVMLTTGFAACKNDTGISQLRYVVAPRPNYGLYLIGISDFGAPEAVRSGPTDQLTAGLLLEAAFKASNEEMAFAREQGRAVKQP